MFKFDYSDALSYYEMCGESSFILAYNDYMTAKCSHNWIRYMFQFNRITKGHSNFDIAERVFNGEFNPYHSFFMIDDYGNFKSFNVTTMLEIIADSIDDWDDLNTFLEYLKENI